MAITSQLTITMKMIPIFSPLSPKTVVKQIRIATYFHQCVKPKRYSAKNSAQTYVPFGV